MPALVRGRLDDAVDRAFIEPAREHLHRVAYIHDLRGCVRGDGIRFGGAIRRGEGRHKGVGEGTYEGVVYVLDPAPFSVRGEDLQGRDRLAVQNRDRAVVCGMVLNVCESGP